MFIPSILAAKQYHALAMAASRRDVRHTWKGPMLTRLLTVLAIATVATPAGAQIRLQPLPGLPLQTAPLQGDVRALDRLSGLRHAEISRLIRANRAVLEADPEGEPIVRREILALSPSDEALRRARSLGFVVAREQALGVAALRVIVLEGPTAISTRQALRSLRDSDPAGTYDYNHIYTHAGGETDTQPTVSQRAAPPPVTRAASPNRQPVRIGLLDTGIDASHPIFHDSVTHTWGCASKSVPRLHGTAVASLLLAHAPAELYSADVYCGLPTGGAADTIVAALAWMTDERVPVINISLVGPRNAMLEQCISSLVARGYLIVAAVGNDGPTAPPLYPAAYANVVGVTGVDAARRVLLEAERGPQVTFAARGADVEAANTEHSFAAVRGTSFAAPVVAALLAQLVSGPDKITADAALDRLAKMAIDLGPPGKDLTYGFGLVGATSPE